MNDVTPRRAALLSALRQAHHAELAPLDLRRRVLSRLESEARSQRFRWAALLRQRRPMTLLLASVAVLLAALVLKSSTRGLRPAEGTSVAFGPEPALRDSATVVPGGRQPLEGSRPPLARPCPLQEVPKGATIAPAETDFDSRRVGLVVRVLELRTPRCGSLTRRYLEYVPASVAGKVNPAIWILLHATGESAEAMRTEETRWYFDALAEREGFIVVYANAAPGLETDPNVPNSGSWQTSERASPYVDDELYLERVVADMRARRGDSGESPVYLVGRVEGADMALSAASFRPDLYSGVAAFSPLTSVEPPRSMRRLRLTRALFVFLGESPGTGGLAARAVAEDWAAALGAPRQTRGGLAGTPPHVAERLDFAVEASSGPAVRLLVLERTSDPFPVPGAYALMPSDGSKRASGVRGAEEAWGFLTGAGEPQHTEPAKVLQDGILLEDDVVFEDDVVGPLPR